MKNGFPAPNKEPPTNQNNYLTGKAPYRFESVSLQRRVTSEPRGCWKQRRVRTVARTRSGGFLLMGSPAFAERRGRPTQRNGIGPGIWRGLFDTSRENRTQLCRKFGLSVRLDRRPLTVRPG